MSEESNTQADSESQSDRYNILLKDSNGNTYNIWADSLVWQWFLVFTCHPDFPPEMIVDDVLQWQRNELPDMELSFLFGEYVANLVQKAGDEGTERLLRYYKKSNSHPIFESSYFKTGQTDYPGS